MNSRPSPNSPDGASSDVPVSAPIGESAAPQSNVVWGLSRNDRWFWGILLIVILGLLTVDAWRRGNAAIRPLVVLADLPPEEFFAVEVNSASWVEWAQLEGLGETLARRIVEDRDERGPFQSPDDLLRVRGIGRRTLDRIRPFLVGFPTETLAPAESETEADSP